MSSSRDCCTLGCVGLLFGCVSHPRRAGTSFRALVEGRCHGGNPASKTDLDASYIWLMPVTHSPSYHGYDASDCYRVEPDYATNADSQRFVSEAHKRGIKVLVDMVLNHCPSEDPGSRNFILV